ncbi:MAG: DUF3276 family protein [Spirochaetales bacterium]|nr:MAG: DUF3276 family protein [Spirochaetales bacterium]
MGIRGEVFSLKAAAGSGKRTYFFNVKENRHGDLFLNVVESKKNESEKFERHSIIVFDEDVDLFIENFKKAADFIKKTSS